MAQLITIQDNKVMMGKFKQPIGEVVKSPFHAGGFLFLPDINSMLSAEMMRQLADEIDKLRK